MRLAKIHTHTKLWAFLIVAYGMACVAGAAAVLGFNVAKAAYQELVMCIDPQTEPAQEPAPAPDPVQELFEAMDDAYAYVSVHTPRARQRAKLAGMAQQPPFEAAHPLIQRLRRALDRIPA